MKVWELDSDANNYDNFTLSNESDWDNPSFLGLLRVFSSNAVKVLKKYLENNAEILPISYDKGEYFIINVTNVKDCIDNEKAEVKRFKSSGKIMRFIKYAFEFEVIKNEHIFKIPELKGRVFVSEEFRQRVMDKDLKGFKFELVWDSQLK
ncbi:hypothetical protein A0J52_01630 [Clostridium sporogenes]|uniref:imm11 family protein n=1 Tax=Clostridium sporogenes TaxID=1509 RepID=UPI000780138B|nr:DUF1629 domain-containing protein [Clostridium sporogenes]KYN78011.1 hypothetical protein A0J52_01630 [Clostridium sporogenes]